jgi:hypothetical protein
VIKGLISATVLQIRILIYRKTHRGTHNVKNIARISNVKSYQSESTRLCLITWLTEEISLYLFAREFVISAKENRVFMLFKTSVLRTFHSDKHLENHV